MSAYRTESCPIDRSDEIKKQWLELQQRAEHSYFLSWGWIGTWLDTIVIELHPVAIKVWLGDELIGLGVFVLKDIKRRGIVSAKAMFLNEYPFDDKNMVIEDNGLLAAAGHEEAVYTEVINYLLFNFREHDEFVFGAVAEEAARLLSEIPLLDNVNRLTHETSTSWFVDLSKFSHGIDNYLASLSRNRRTQVRRSLKIYDHNGSLKIEQALNIDQALYYFENLKILHTDYWQSKGQSGSFANPQWLDFHCSLIRNRFSEGEVQLLKVSNSDGEIGYLYNLVLDKHVYVVQTGFKQSDDKRLMPGYVAHVLAIAHNRAKSMLSYDLMHGDSLYKQILCNRKRKLSWIVLQRKRLRFSVENLAVGIVRYLRSNRNNRP